MGKMGEDEREMLDLVGLIYDVAMQPNRWPMFLERLAAYLHAKSAFFRLSDTSNDQVHMAFAYGIDDDYFSDYRDHYIHCDPYRVALKRHPAGVFYPGQAALPYEQYEKSECYNDLTKLHGLYYTLGGFALRDGPLAFQIAVQRGKNESDYQQEEINCFNNMIPHFQRAFMINRHIARLEVRSSMTEQALDQLSIGVILIDEHGTPCYINHMAENILAAKLGLQIIKGKLATHFSAESCRLQQLIREAVSTGMSDSSHPGGAMQLSSINTSTRPLSLLVTPLHPDASQTVFVGSRICAAIFVGSSEQTCRLNPEVLQMLYGLTPAEANLATELARGNSIENICNHFYISKHTVRTQLKSIFQKTCTNRQAELVSLLLRSPASL